jgi:hypothetical protein
VRARRYVVAEWTREPLTERLHYRLPFDRLRVSVSNQVGLDGKGTVIEAQGISHRDVPKRRWLAEASQKGWHRENASPLMGAGLFYLVHHIILSAVRRIGGRSEGSVTPSLDSSSLRSSE